ncbi:DNA-directed DNA polymerase epsilon, subunit B [Dispira simplex]|nr:DNA-directed DNA polymerase epsilon, subunit B [Dispira simplex]
MSVTQQIYRTFTKTHGLTIRTDASRYLQSTLAELDLAPSDILSWLDDLALLWIKREANGSIVELEPLKILISTLQQTHQAIGELPEIRPNDSAFASDLPTQLRTQVDIRDHLHPIDAFSIPRWKYDALRKTFILYPHTPKLLESAETKAQVFQDRYDLIRQRLLRNEHFVPSTFTSEGEDEPNYCRLDTIEALQGRDGESFMLLGMLSQLEEGVLSLEDRHRSVKLNLSEMTLSNQSSGLFTENCLVLVEGVYQDNVFKVEALGLPPAEPARMTYRHFPKTNFFGGPPSLQDRVVLQQIQDDHSDASLVILSDVWLDRPAVLDKLKIMFQGFDALPIVPLAFVLMGDFSSVPFLPSQDHILAYKRQFDQLATLIQSFKRLVHASYFLFVPGTNDPWVSNLLPRPAIPKFFTTTLASKITRARFLSNPCRLRYCNRDLVIFRQDLMNKLRRNCIIVPSDEHGKDMKRHLVRTLIDQSHLCPLPLRVAPVYWAFDHALRLYPIPDTLILADKYDAYSVEYEGCCCINPGSFANNDFGFYVHYLNRNQAQFSAIPK